MASVYQNVIPTLIENTTMRLRIVDDVPQTYWITPIDGYVLHDKVKDANIVDPITGEIIHVLGYGRGVVSCGASYDFKANPREFFAVPKDSVLADKLFGVGGNSHATS